MKLKLEDTSDQVCTMAYGACDTCGNSYEECDCLDRDQKTINKIKNILGAE